MAGGVNNDSQVIAYTITSAVPYAGMLLKGTTADSTMDLLGASTDEPMGYTYVSSKDNFMTYSQDGGTAKAGARIGVHALIEGQKANMVVGTANTAIAIGDKVKVYSAAGGAGYVDKYTSETACWQVGTAETAVDATAGVGTVVVVRISKRYIPA
jgi:hypothetical protein